MDLKQIVRRVIHVGFLVALVGRSVHAQIHICPAPSWSLSESVSRADAVCLAKLISSSTPDNDGFRDVTFEVVEVLKSPPGTVRKGGRINHQFSGRADKGALFLIIGEHHPKEPGIDWPGILWNRPTETTRACFDYIAQAPAPASDSADQRQKLLRHLVQFVDTRDKLIRADLIREFKDAHVADLRTAVPAMPRDKLRKLLVGSETPDELPGFACYLLGLCGENSLDNGADLKRLEAKVAEKWPKDAYRAGTDYMMMGYLLLAGEAGLNRLDAWKIKDRSSQLGEAYCEMLALRFLWKNGEGKISHDRLVQSMRLFLDRPDLADIAIADLARWRDWKSLDRIIGLYGQGPFNVPAIKRAIIRYLYSCAESKPTAVRPEQASSARGHLAELRRKDPKLVADVERRMADNPE
jgi:hypothetical protein